MVSLLLLLAMAFTRHQVVATSTSSQHGLFRWAQHHKLSATLLPWFIGIVFTCLHFVDVANGQLVFRAFFEPLSKLTILLPSGERPTNYYVQTSLAGIVSLLTIWYSVRAWRVISINAKTVMQKGMIR